MTEKILLEIVNFVIVIYLGFGDLTLVLFHAPSSFF